jgi:hypothetical protein
MGCSRRGAQIRHRRSQWVALPPRVTACKQLPLRVGLVAGGPADWHKTADARPAKAARTPGSAPARAPAPRRQPPLRRRSYRSTYRIARAGNSHRKNDPPLARPGNRKHSTFPDLAIHDRPGQRLSAQSRAGPCRGDGNGSLRSSREELVARTRSGVLARVPAGGCPPCWRMFCPALIFSCASCSRISPRRGLFAVAGSTSPRV